MISQVIFSWTARNIDHIGKHDVSPLEAEEIVRAAKPPFPRRIMDDKFLVWGVTGSGRYLQVVFVPLDDSDVEWDSLAAEDFDEFLTGHAKVAYVVHAMDMTDRQKRQFRQGRR